MRRFLLNVIAFVLLLILTSCSKIEIKSGYVVHKEFTPSRTVVLFNAAIKAPQVMRYPDCWHIWIANKFGVEKHRVDETTYHNISNGEYVGFETEECGMFKQIE